MVKYIRLKIHMSWKPDQAINGDELKIINIIQKLRNHDDRSQSYLLFLELLKKDEKAF
jgi:hypothetical protein